jgi:hypothetical protein
MILNVLGALLFSYYFIAIAVIPAKIKMALKLKWHQRLKPFDCMTCLSAWTALLLFILPPVCSEIAVVMFGAGYLGSKIKI